MIYRNYDGSNGRFGNKEVYSSDNDVAKTSIYASLNDNNSELHIIALNKTNETIEGHFSVAGNMNFNQGIQTYGFSDGNPSVTFLGTSNILNNNQFTYSIQPLSVMHFVLVNSSSVIENGNTPDNYNLSQNFPNPFNPSTKIMYAVRERSQIKIQVYDVLGKVIKTLVNSEMDKGTYSIIFSGEGLSSGVYFYKIEAIPLQGGEGYSGFKKMVLLR